ncbi:hypothetical protein B0H17DRAFT_1131914 [Mycena rosella]|uniref:Uncharacterized protein n=1 Tax=Mycena rosella TaxID=1033263 RepID=A0AAD7DM36_MYCRO|nr:hypothetical protein B0H17DRAFT_1131914 [Mycena rosella]
MAALYLLGNPNRYTNLVFKPFWWRSYVSEVKRACPAVEGKIGLPTERQMSQETDPEVDADQSDRVLLSKKGDQIVGVTTVDDYIFRPTEFENTSLFDYFQIVNRVKRTKKQYGDFMESFTAFRPSLNTH